MGSTVDDVGNGLTLRCDVRRLLDNHAFVFYPVGNRKYVTYVLRESAQDYVELLHGREVTAPLRVSDEFLYARFAYNIIKPRSWVFPLSVVGIPVDPVVARLQQDLRSSKEDSPQTACESSLLTMQGFDNASMFGEYALVQVH